MRFAVVLVALLAGGVFSRPAQAEVFHDAEIQPVGQFDLGFEGQFLFNPANDQIVYGHFGMGIFDKASANIRFGTFSRNANEFRGEFRYGLLENGDGYPAIMVYGNGNWIDRSPVHQKGFPGVGGGVEISETILEQSWYVGYEVDADFIPELTRILFQQHVFLGVKIPASDHLAFFAEAGYGVPTQSVPDRDWVSGGVSFSF
jgi:hypothetical protein